VKTYAEVNAMLTRAVRATVAMHLAEPSFEERMAVQPEVVFDVPNSMRAKGDGSCPTT